MPDGRWFSTSARPPLLPRLLDTHVHLAFDASGDPTTALSARDDRQALEAARQAGQEAIRGGVTTVRDLGDRNHLSLDLRGERDLPTIVAAGPPITTAGAATISGGVGAGGIGAAVRQHAERGVDVVKIMASGGTLTSGTRRR